MAQAAPSERERGLRLLRNGSYGASIELLYRALSEDPDDAEVYMAIGYAFAQTGQIEKSIDVLEQGVNSIPTSAKMHYNLGVAYQRAARNTLAKDEYLRALSLDPSYIAAKHALDYLTKLGLQARHNAA